MRMTSSSLFVIGCLVGLGWAGGLGVAQGETTNAPSRLSYDGFRLVSERNIFNPNRYSRATGTRPPSTRTTPRAANKVETISLVGIMGYEKGLFAFFDGSGGDFKKARQSGERIGEYTVARITPDFVKLMTGTNELELKVGMQLRREDEGDWYLTETADTPRRRVVVSNRTRTRPGGQADSAVTTEAGFEGESGEPEVIILDPTAFGPENGNGQNGNATAGERNGAPTENGERPAQAEPATEEVSDPVLLRLMQRRQELR